MDPFESGDEWHFSAALGIVLRQLYGGNTNLPWYDIEELKSAVVNCRLVSKSVKEVVDSFVKLHWENYSFNAPSATIIHPFEMLPILVHEEIFDKLESPLNKLDLIKAYPRLEHLEYYQEKKTEWGFTAILKPLLKNFYLDKYSEEDELKSAVRNCRLLCKSTKKIVDSFVDFYWEKFWDIAPFASPFPLKCLEHVDMCLAQADQLQRNNRSISPFICGGLLYIFCGEEWNFNEPGNIASAPPSLQKTVQLVSHPNIGINLRGIRIAANFRADDLQGTCNFVRNLLHFAPNIVSLSINLFPVGNVNRAEQELDVPALPELPHLKVLEVYGNSDYENEAYSLLRDNLDLRQYFAQLISLEMPIFLWKEQYNGLVQYPQLKYFMLHVPIVGWNERLWNIIVNLKAPALKRLSLITVNFDLEEMNQEYILFDTFATNLIPEAIRFRRRDQIWGVTSTKSGTPDIIALTYTFTLMGWIVRRQ